tara:strand:- start:185 stop:418 length:234 start_codon:yes stop_codon:yes gene_type:complete
MVIKDILPVVVAVAVATAVRQVELVVLEEVVMDLTFLTTIHRQQMEITALEAVVEVDLQLLVMQDLLLAQQMVVPVS